MFDPTIGRWLSEDPAEYDEDNLYRYIGNSPTNGTDPSGLAPPGGIAPSTYNPTLFTGPPTDNNKLMNLIFLNGRNIGNNWLNYYENVGWVDWKHANPEWPFQFLKRLATEKNDELGLPIGAFLEPATPTTVKLEERFIVKINLGGGIQNLPAPERFYWVKKGLTEQQRKEVGLAIFQDYAVAFEEAQWKALNWGGSGFSQEDLSSNLLGFYFATMGYKSITPDSPERKEVEEKYLGRKLSEPDTWTLFNSLGGDLGDQNNRHYNFQPVSHHKAAGFPGVPKLPPPGIPEITPASAGQLWGMLSINSSNVDNRPSSLKRGFTSGFGPK